MPRYKYDSAVELAYSRAHRTSRKANDLHGVAMGDPKNVAKHRRAAKMFRLAARMHLKTAKYDAARAKRAAKDSVAQAIWHDRYAAKIARGEMGAPGSFHEMHRYIRGGLRDRRRRSRRRTRRSSRRRSYR